MVEAARIAYRDFPTVVNQIAESNLSYSNTMEEYAKMDSKMQSAQRAIGGSSDSAQLSQSYMWTKVYKGELDDEYLNLYHNTIILAVLAQVAIDGCKRIFEVDVNDDIKRIRAQGCMKKDKDYPKFMKYTHEIAITKNGKTRDTDEIQKEKRKIRDRIDYSIICPMNWLQECLDKIQGSSRTDVVPTENFFIHKSGKANSRQMSKIRVIVDSYDAWVKANINSVESLEYDSENGVPRIFVEKFNEVMDAIRKYNISAATMNRLIQTSLMVDGAVTDERQYQKIAKNTRKLQNVLYNFDKKKFLSNFKTQ